nr:caspase-3 [Ciona intestinalis]|eukprot:XP_026691379.1 caspase-3 [Ciona intestinalis]
MQVENLCQVCQATFDRGDSFDAGFDPISVPIRHPDRTTVRRELKDGDDKIEPSVWDVKFDYFEYNMSFPKRGIFLIFDQENFDYGLQQRVGSKLDRIVLEETAIKLGFTPNVCHDYTKDDVYAELRKISQMNHSQYDCFACAILTHGEEDEMVYAKDDSMKLKTLISRVSATECPSLAGKPKLFFVQACRGKEISQPAICTTACLKRQQVQSDSIPDVDSEETPKIPAEADILVAYSTQPGQVSVRNEYTGSVFVQTMCAALKQRGGELELVQLLTRVNRNIALTFETNMCSPKFDKKKQMPSIVSQLTAELYFRPKDTVS